MILDDMTAAERDDFNFLQNPGVVNYYPTSIESAKHTGPNAGDDDLMMMATR